MIVAQLVRALHCGSRGRGFEPRLSPEMKNVLLVTLLALLFSCNNKPAEDQSSTADSTVATETPAADPLDTTGGKGVFFVELKDSQEVKSPFIVKMGINGMEIEPAGTVNDMKGHHHIIIDGAAIAEGAQVQKKKKNLHFGKGQTESELKLTPGLHTITLQFANGVHASYGPRWSRTITVKVK